MTQLTFKECTICGTAIGILNVMTLIEGGGYWTDATKGEIQELLHKLEQIQIESIKGVLT